jgi:hypothetical protein
MNICSNCGVELDANMRICPLCGVDPMKPDADEIEKGTYPSDIIMMHRIEIRKNIWELTGIVTFSAIIVCTIVDLFIGKGLKWSLYSDSAITAAWLMLSFILKFPRKPFIILAAICFSVLSMLFIFDLLDLNSGWFFPVGMPITLAAVILSGFTVAVRLLLKHGGFNIIGVAFLAVAFFCILVELFTDKFRFGVVDIKWSIITAASIFPLCLIFFFLHYRMKKGNRLDSFLHI